MKNLDELKHYQFSNNEKVILDELNYYKNGVQVTFLKNKFICENKKFEMMISNLNQQGFIEIFDFQNEKYVKIKD